MRSTASFDLDSPYEVRSSYRAGEQPIDGYRLLSSLGYGGFGEVWKCLAPGGMFKAMKIVTRSEDLLDNQVATIDQEYLAINRVKDIRHPFLITLDRVDASDRELIVVMDLADSSLLHEFEQYQLAGHQGIPEDELLHYLQEAAEALDVLNFQYGLQHLDVKPANLLISNRHTKLADFGLVSDAANRKEAGQPLLPVGFTPRYAAPELLQGNVSRFCDQYSLAVVYQELLTGSVPFEGGSLLKRLITSPGTRGLPETDWPVLAQALAANPQNRFPSCLEFVRALIAAKFVKSGSRFLRVQNFSSLMVRQSVHAEPLDQGVVSDEYHDDESLVETPPPPGRAAATALSHPTLGSSTTTHWQNRKLLNSTSGKKSEQIGDSTDWTELPGIIYPLTIHLSDLRWKPGSVDEVAPPVDVFLDRLIAAVTELGCLPKTTQRSPSLGGSSIVEDSFMIAGTSKQDLQLKFSNIVKRCRAEEIRRSESSILFAVEGTLPIWEIFSSKQRILVVSVEVAESCQVDLSKVAVRIEPLISNGPSLHPRIIDIRLQVQECLREILRVVPERRRSERADCNFGVELYPILRDWRFGPRIAGLAADISAKGIGLTALSPPSTKRFYLRPTAPNPLSEYAILAEVVRHSPNADGSFDWGAALGLF